MARPSASAPLAVAALIGVGLGWAAAGLSACGDTRFPTCQTNADCLSRDAGVFGPVCYNLRCVECQYDSDCPGGRVCSRDQTCDPLQSEKAWTPVVMKPRPAASGASSEQQFQACAEACKTKACVDACNEKFSE